VKQYKLAFLMTNGDEFTFEFDMSPRAVRSAVRRARKRKPVILSHSTGVYIMYCDNLVKFTAKDA
jgi:hypothetical protein